MKYVGNNTIKKILDSLKSLFITKDKFKVLTQAEYNELEIKDTDTYYFIKEE